MSISCKRLGALYDTGGGLWAEVEEVVVAAWVEAAVWEEEAAAAWVVVCSYRCRRGDIEFRTSSRIVMHSMTNNP